MSVLDEQYEQLRQILTGLKRVVVAFSGGVDSSFLLFAARKTLGRENVLAVTANSQIYPSAELKAAREFTGNYDIPHRIIETCGLEEINRNGNSPDRCYHCKKELFTSLRGIAREGGYAVAEGSNLDDGQDYRPGRRAAYELKIAAPLKEAGMTKEDIRRLSRTEGLPGWDKPAYACLTSRFPYHVEIKQKDLILVESSEQYLHSLGFVQCRVRHYGSRARVEISRDKLAEALEQTEKITQKLMSLGYKEVEIDPQGYRTGSMNVFDR